MPFRPTLLASVLLAVSGAAAQAATFTVTTTADSGPGSLRAAILAANAEPGAHTIEFAPGFPLSGVVLLSSALPTITAERLAIDGSGREPRIDGNNQHRPFTIEVSVESVEFQSLHIRNGRVSLEFGGCVFGVPSSLGGNLTFRNVELRNCRSVGSGLSGGGAIYWPRPQGLLVIEDAYLIENESEVTAASGSASGGAVFTNAGLRIENTVFESNRAFASSPTGSSSGFGGAISVSNPTGSLSIERSIFATQFIGNSTLPSPGGGLGGAVLVGSGIEIRFDGSWFADNSSTFGGALGIRLLDIGSERPRVLLAQTSFVNNVAANSGGAITLDTGDLGVLAATFYNNSAPQGAHLGFPTGAAIESFENTLLGPTSSGDPCQFNPLVLPGALIGRNLVSGSGCNFARNAELPSVPLGTISIDESPGLIPVVRFSGAAVIDSIPETAFCGPVDARGTPRPQDGNGDGIARCDVGAYEAPGPMIFRNGFEP